MKRVIFVLAATTLLTGHRAEAQITRIVIDRARSESPTVEGRSFGPDNRVGPYEKLVRAVAAVSCFRGVFVAFFATEAV
jgi:hypothetical protein